MASADGGSAQDVTFALCTAADVESVLAFSAENGFTRRSVESWNGENMDAALAFDAGRLIGAIPFARRSVQMSREAALRCGYLSGVVLDAAYRGGGLGTRLLRFLAESYPVDGFMVNSFLDDAAYRWYTRNGFVVATKVRSLRRDNAGAIGEGSVLGEVVELTDDVLSEERVARLRQLFDARYGTAGGFEARDATFWNRRLRHHFYRAFNRYYLLSTTDNGAYSFVSLNSHPSARRQIDVLESCFSTARQLDELLSGARRLAADLAAPAIRFAVTIGSELETELERAGFSESGRFDILFRGASDRKVDTRSWTFFMWDYA